MFDPKEYFDLIGQKIFSRKAKSKLTVGLDIGNSSVKVVQLLRQPNTKEIELVSFGIAPIKGPNSKDIVQSITQVMETAQINTKRVNTSVSGQAVIVRYIQMPKMTKPELAKALQFEAGKYIPFNVDEVNYDFQILDKTKKAEKTMRVLLVAAKKEIIEKRIKILNQTDLSPNIIDVDSFSIINSFALVSQENKGVIAIVDIGADITSITILQDNTPYFSRDVLLGGNDLTKAIIEEFEFSPVEADEFKHDPKHRYGELISVIRPVLDSLCDEMHSSFNYCESQLGGSVQKIFLTGGTAKFKGIDKVLNSILGIDAEVWDPTKNLQINPSLSKARLMEIGPLLTVSIGLALRG